MGGSAHKRFVWFVATYGAGTLLVNERRQLLAPEYGGTELGGVYVPAETAAPQHGAPQPRRPTVPNSGLTPPPLHADPPPGARTLSMSARVSRFQNGAPRPTNLWDDGPSGGLAGMGTGGMPDGQASLDTLGQTLYPLFCVSVHEHAWMAAGYGVWGKETYLERFWSCLDWGAVRVAYSRCVGQNRY
ncbi:hypothetical protein F5148DRAFT_472233 [Russula earlei]|uniref:Uncharacterized protein n=1 Tax=Russula earlei TaxID=71964 RepID=A0ACC0UI83_9AGAM|nr:hypothetical protein F5148DRAFT_472233 [Russula earlei]